jgi:DNA recombination protein RmuC
MEIISIVVGIISLIIGAAAAYILLNGKLGGQILAAEQRIEEIRRQEDEAKAKRDELQNKLNTVLPLEGEIKSVRESIESLQAENESLRLAVSQERTIRFETESELKSERAKIDEKEQALKRERERYQEEKKTLEDSFANLSRQALAQAQNSFLELANEKFRDQRQVSQQEMDKILAPMKQTLEQLSTHTKEIEEKRTSSYSELSTQIKGLMQTTSSLSNALKRPEVRGNWGELTLIRVAESAGLVDGKDYKMQVSEDTEEGRLRPDMIVYLPNKRNIVVDSKTPYFAFQAATETDDEAIKQLKLREHAAQVRKHIQQLSSKKYQYLDAGSVDFVVMFVPNEALYQAAIQQDVELIDYALDKRVVLANPMTLIALLRTVANGIEQQKAYESAMHIAKLGGDLHDSVAVFADHYAKIGKSLDAAVKRYNEGVGSLERNVVSKGRQLKEFGVKSAKAIEEIENVETNIRAHSLPSPELEDSAKQNESLF